jgi:glycosyltransferase involved in cell wall biosynthesis
MKILFLSHVFPPNYTSGAENYTFNLAQALVQHGHQVYVLCAETWDSGAHYWNGHTDEMYEGIWVRRLNLCWHKAPDPNRYLYDNPVTAEHLRVWLPEVQPDVAHVTSCYTLSASIIQVCKNAGLPVVVTLVDFWFLCPSLHLLRRDGALCDGQTTPWLCLQCVLGGAKTFRWPSRLLPDSLLEPILTSISQRPAVSKLRGLRGMALNMAERKQVTAERLRQADVILAPSQFLASLHAAVIDDLPLWVKPYGHDLSWLTGYRGRLPDDGLRFCYMGQISDDKGVHVLVEAFLRLDSTAGVTLDIWGGLDSRTAYVSRIKELAARSDNIHLCGRFSRSELGHVLSQTDVVVVPSLWYENNPLVIQEAYAARVPVIASDLGGMSEYVRHEVNGLLFERGDVDDLARQLRRVVTEPTLLTQLRAGIPSVKTIEQETDELLNIYEQLL